MIRSDGFARLDPRSGCSAPDATVTIYLPGTTTPATIYSDNANPPTPLSNPLTADSNGYYYYYGEGRFDEHISGTGVATPYTLADHCADDTLQGRGLFNVKASPYNAAGDGTTDDTDAIALAITDASAVGGTVYFTRGTYKLTDVLSVEDNYVRFLGEERAVSVLSWTDTATAGLDIKGDATNVNTTLSADGATGDRSVSVTSATGLTVGAWAYLEDTGSNTTSLLTRIHAIDDTTVTLEDALPGPLTTANTAKLYSYTGGLLDGIEVRNLKFRCAAEGSTTNKLSLLKLTRCVNGRIAHCSFNGAVAPLVTQTTCRGGVVQACDFQNALTVAGTAVETLNSTAMSIVASCVRVCQFGFTFASSPYCRLESNSINGRQTSVDLGRGIRYGQSSNFGAAVGNNVSDTNLYGIYLQDAAYCTVASNTIGFTGSATNTGQHGIQLGGAEADFCHNNSVTGNVVVGASGYGIVIAPTVSPEESDDLYNTLTGNVTVDCLWGGIAVQYGSHNVIAGNNCRSGEDTVSAIIRILASAGYNTISGNVVTASSGTPTAISTSGGGGFNQIFGNIVGSLSLSLHADDVVGASTSDVSNAPKPMAPVAFMTGVSTGADTTETTFLDYTIPGGTLVSLGQGFEFVGHFTTPSTDSKTLKAYLGSASISASLSDNAEYEFRCEAIYTDSTHKTLSLTIWSSGGAVRRAAYLTRTHNFASDQHFKVTGTNGVAVAGDMAYNWGRLTWVGLPSDAYSS